MANLGFKYRKAKRISPETLEEIIRNVQIAKNPSITNEELSNKLAEIKKITNSQIEKYYNDSRLTFNIKSDNLVNEIDYQPYLEKIKQIIESKTDEEKILSTYTFVHNQKQQVFHSLVKAHGDKTEKLLEGTFDLNYDFGKKFLLPEINCYIEKCKLPVGEIAKPEYLNLNIRDYKMTSENGLSLSIEAGDLDFIKSLDKNVKNRNQIQQESEQIQMSINTTRNVDLNNLDKEELTDLKRKATEIKMNDFNQYRANMMIAYTCQKSEEHLYSSFTIDPENDKMCNHRLEKVSKNSRELIIENNFLIDDTFKKELLEQSIIDFAKTNPIDTEQMETQENGLTRYRVFSQMNNILELNNFDKNYVKTISQNLKKVANMYYKNLEQNESQIGADDEIQLKMIKGNSGFTNVLMVMGVIASLIMLITVLFLNIKR